MKSIFCRLGVVNLLLISGFIFHVQNSLGKDLLISSFESEEDLAKFEVSEGVKIERSTDHVTHGNYSLKVTFPGTSLPFLTTADIPSIDLPPERVLYLRINYPNYSTRDFSNYEYLEMDVYHEGPGGTPNLDYPYFDHHVGRIDLYDSKGNWRPSWVPIIVYPYKNEGRVQLPLFFGPGLISEKNKFSFSDVATIQITMPRPQKDWIVYIDDIRLVPPSPPTTEYEPLPRTSSASLKDIARFKTLSVYWIGDGRIEDLVKEYPTLEVLKKNAVQLKIGIPTYLEELNGYDIIIFDDFPVNKLLSSTLNLVKEYYDKGGSVVMFGGRNSFAGDYGIPGYQNTPIEGILPVNLLRPGMYRQFMHYTHYVRLNIKQSENPVMEGLPWMEGFRFVIPDGITEPPDGYNRFIEPKPETKLLAIDDSGDVPIIVTGKRSLIFNLEPRLRRYYFSYDFWERFVIQSFNHITEDKKQEGVILAKIDLPSLIDIDRSIIEGKIYPVNLGDRQTKISIGIEIYSISVKEKIIEKEIEMDVKPNSVEGFSFSIPVSGLKTGNYEILARLKEPRTSVLTSKLEVRPALSVENLFPEVVLVKGKDTNLGVEIKNISDESKKGRIEIWLKNGDRNLMDLIKKEITIGGREDKTIRYQFQPDVSEGRYKICSYLYSEDMLLAKTEDEVRIIGESIPVLNRDIDIRVQGVHFLEEDIFSLTKSLSLEGDTGLKRGSELSTELSPCFLTWGERIGYPLSWENYITSLHNLRKNKISFVINSFNFWAGRSKYELIVNGLKRQIKLADEIAGEYFLGIRLSESEAIPWQYIRYREQETKEDRADAFAGIIKQIISDIELPEDKLLLLDVSTPIPYDWLFASGADVVGQASPVPITPIPLSQSALRGMARSFNKWWEWEIVRWGLSDKPTVLLPYHPRTGRPTPELHDIDSSFWQQDSRETHKMYVSAYYNGAKMINAYSEDPKKGSSKEAILKFKEFIKSNPRCEDIITPIAVVRGKGCSSVLPTEPPFGMVSRKWERYYEKEDDFLYLNLFFPNFSDDGTTTKYWWTGTPYGTVDIIYPEMRLKGLQRYNALIFLGRQRIDSVRDNFIVDLMEYVRQGGIVLLTAEQLRNLQGELSVPEKFIGAVLSVETKPIKDWIETSDVMDFNILEKRYTLSDSKPIVYGVLTKGAEVIAKDSHSTPVILLNKYGKGYVFLFTSPNLSIIPPAGKSELIQDIIDKAAKYKPLPIIISPPNPQVEFLISKTGNKEATVFIMNHGEKDWTGDIRVNLKSAGLDREIGKTVISNMGRGYDVTDIAPKIAKAGDNLIISGIELKGDTSDFISYRQASFAVVRLER